MTAAIAIASVITTAVGAGMQYTAQRRQAKAQEAAAEYNAKVLQNQALHENDVAAENARRMGEQKQRRLASLRARKAGAGVSFTGSVVDQLEATNFALERNIQDSIYQQGVRSNKLRQQADMTIWEGKVQANNTRANANASLLMGASDVSSQLYDGYKSGVFNPAE